MNLYKMYELVPHVILAENPDEAREIFRDNFELYSVEHIHNNHIQSIECEEDIPPNYLHAFPLSKNSCIVANLDLDSCNAIIKKKNSACKIKVAKCDCGCNGYFVEKFGVMYSIFSNRNTKDSQNKYVVCTNHSYDSTYGKFFVTLEEAKKYIEEKYIELGLKYIAEYNLLIGKQ